MSETFDDGGLADTGLAYQHRVVLRASRQDLDGLFDFIGTADDRVDAPSAGLVGQVESELVQRRGGCRGLRCDRAALQCGLQMFGCDAGSGEQTTRSPVMVGGEREEQMFWVDVRRAQGLGELVSLEHSSFQCSAQRCGGETIGRRSLRKTLFNGVRHRRRVGPGALHQRFCGLRGGHDAQNV